jgi:hypothetical protein
LHKDFVGKTVGKRLLGRARLRWENNITMDLKELGREHELE